MEIAALVPMRHHSARVPHKNFREFGGRPLFHHIIDKLLECRSISRVVIDTDSCVIREDAALTFPDVVVLERPEHLQADTIPMNDVLLHTVSQVDADFYLQTHSTNPLLRSDTIERAITQFLRNWPHADSLFGVTRLQARLWDQLARAINHNPTILLQTQDLPPVFVENSCLYIFTKQQLQDRHNRIGARPQMFEIEKVESWDIDDPLDFHIAEAMFGHLDGKRSE